MSNWNPVKQALCNAYWDKQHYDIYLMVKDLPDDTNITFNLKFPDTNEIFARTTMTVGDLREFAKQIEERNVGKPKE